MSYNSLSSALEDMDVEGWTCPKCQQDHYDQDMEGCGCGYNFDPTKDYDHYWCGEEKFDLPAKWEICLDCGGDGKTYLGIAAEHQPAFTREDFDYEGPDFYEDYMRGRYDAQCPGCKGSGKVKVIDEEMINKGTDQSRKQALAAWRTHCEEEAEYQAEVAAERRMGA